MTKEEQFVNELIGYIFAYPDDDYMTMECLCRKLHKYGLIEKKDGEWTTDFIDHKTELTHNQHVQHIGSVETMSCQECKHFHENAVMYLDQCDFCFKDCKYKPKDEPQLDCLTCRYNSDEWDSPKCDGCSKAHSNYEPQTERSE